MKNIGDTLYFIGFHVHSYLTFTLEKTQCICSIFNSFNQANI